MQQRRLRPAGHCYRSYEAVASLILWQPKHGHRRPGRAKLDYVTLLTQDTSLARNSAQPCQIESCGEIMWIWVRPIDDDDDIYIYKYDDDDDIYRYTSTLSLTILLESLNNSQTTLVAESPTYPATKQNSTKRNPSAETP